MSAPDEGEPFTLGPFTLGQCGLASVLALLVQGGMVAALVASAGAGSRPPPPPATLAIRVTPLPDIELPKKGSAKKRRLPNLARPAEPEPEPEPGPEREAEPPSAEPQVKPDPPKPVAPSTKVKKRPAAKRESRKRQQTPPTVGGRAKPKLQMPRVPSEGDEDGFAEGTTGDPLKARAVDVYAYRLMAWFNRGFTVEPGAIECDVLKKLRTRVSVRIGEDRRVLSYRVTAKSGNEHFDQQVRARMQSALSAQVPPPPPKYPDLLTSDVLTVFSGEKQCD